MVASHVPLIGWTGNLETSVFQMLSEGNTVQLVPGMGAALDGIAPPTRTRETMANTSRRRDRRGIPSRFAPRGCPVNPTLNQVSWTDGLARAAAGAGGTR